jgi:hypothetical protein
MPAQGVLAFQYDISVPKCRAACQERPRAYYPAKNSEEDGYDNQI